MRRRVSLQYPYYDLLTLTVISLIAPSVNMADESAGARSAEEGESSLSRL